MVPVVVAISLALTPLDIHPHANNRARDIQTQYGMVTAFCRCFGDLLPYTSGRALNMHLISNLEWN